MKDISSRKDIKFIIVSFYDKLLSDNTMIPFFKKFSDKTSLEHHLEVITNFWEDVLFDSQQYKTNLLKKHTDVHSYLPFKTTDFTVWMSYFLETIDNNFSGINSEKMKIRANSIATVMQIKMNLYS